MPSKQAYRCHAQSCREASAPLFHLGPQEATECPVCHTKRPNLLLKLQNIHLLVPAAEGEEAGVPGTEHDWNVLCNPKIKVGANHMATTVSSAATCFDCLSHPGFVPDTESEPRIIESQKAVSDRP